MKKFLFLLVVMTLAFILSACAPVAGVFVQLDPALADWIVIGATVVVGFLFAKANEIPAVAKLIAYFKLDQYKLTISAWLAGVVIQLLQVNVLDRIPSSWDEVATIFMKLAIAVIATLYGFRLLADRGVKGFK